MPVEDLVRDVKHMARGLRKSPGFTLAVILTLALGIGANTAIFSVVDQLLLRPLPYPNGDELVTVYELLPKHGRADIEAGRVRDDIKIAYKDGFDYVCLDGVQGSTGAAGNEVLEYVGIPTLLIAGPYALAMLCEALAPLFESGPLPSIGGGPMSRLSQSLSASLPLHWDAVPLWDIPLFIAAGLYAVVGTIATNPRNALFGALLILAGIPVYFLVRRPEP